VDEATIKLGRGLPVPLRLTMCGEPAALSATESVAVKLVADAGLKVTEIVQLALAFKEPAQVLVWLKSVGLAPARVMPLMVSEALPVFLSVTVCAAAVVPVSVVKLSELGVSETTGALAAIPVPLSAAVWVAPAALSVTVSVAVKLAAEAGVKLTAMAQEASIASELPQLLVWLKSAAFVPVMTMLVMASAAVPTFSSLMF
jgi:hypothetical protein